MKRKRIVVMGFMGSCPIAGVIWQHIHYIVGLQKLGHDVFYIEDSARIPYNPDTFDVCNDYTYAARILGLFRDPSRYARLALSSFDEYRSRLNWDASVTQVLHLVEQMVQPGWERNQ